MDLGAPSSYMALAEGTEVFASDEESLGTVERVLADPDVDIFDGLVIGSRSAGSRFVRADDVAEVYERGVVLKLDSAAAAALPEPEPGAGR